MKVLEGLLTAPSSLSRHTTYCQLRLPLLWLVFDEANTFPSLKSETRYVRLIGKYICSVFKQGVLLLSIAASFSLIK